MKQNLVVINVLDQKSYDNCHIKGSVNVPVKLLPEYVKRLPIDTLIVLYCASYDCNASYFAWQSLQDALGSLPNVYVYEGGIAEWHQKGYPTEGSCADHYLKIAQPITHRDVLQSISAEELKKKIEQSELL